VITQTVLRQPCLVIEVSRCLQHGEPITLAGLLAARTKMETVAAVALEAAGAANNNLWFDTVSERGIRSLDTLPREQPWRDASR